MNAVRWLTGPDDIAALVTDSGSDRLVAELFHFGPEARPMGARLLLLAPGRYRWSLTSGGETLAGSDLEVGGPRAAVGFELPPRELCTLTVVASGRARSGFPLGRRTARRDPLFDQDRHRRTRR